MGCSTDYVILPASFNLPPEIRLRDEVIHENLRKQRVRLILSYFISDANHGDAYETYLESIMSRIKIELLSRRLILITSVRSFGPATA